VAGLFDDAKSFYLDDTPLVSLSGANNFSPFRLDVYHGDPSASVVKNKLGGLSSPSNVGATLVSGVGVIRQTPSGLSNQIDVLEVRLVINQLVQVSDNGDQNKQDGVFKIEYRSAGASTWLPWFDTATFTLTGKTSGGYVKEFRKPVPRQVADWEIRVTQVSSSTSTTNVVRATWESFQCIIAKNRAYDNLALVKGIARAGDQFTSIPTFTSVWSGFLVKIPTVYNPLTRYMNGTWSGDFELGHTDNPAWCLYDLVTHPDHGLKQYLPNIQFDKYSALEAAQWCDAFVPRGTTGTYQPRWTYNDYITEARPGVEWARYLAGSFGGIFSSDLNHTVRLKIDKPGSIVQIYGPESIESAGFSYTVSDVTTRPNDIMVSFINPILGWETDVRRVYDQTLIDRNGRIPLDFVAIGCLDAYEAQRRAYNILLKANTEILTVNFQTVRPGLLLEVYDIIGIADPAMSWGLSGRVKSVVGSVITLRDSLLLPVATDITMTVQCPSGPQTLTVRTATANTTTLNITSGTFPSDAPDRAQFSLTSATIGLVKPFRVLGVARDTNNPELFSISALELNTSRFSDVDNYTGSSNISYERLNPSRPPTPIISLIDSSIEQQILESDGTLTNRVLVEVKIPAGGFTQRVELLYKSPDQTEFEVLTSKNRRFYIPDAKVGQVYQIKVVGIRGSSRSLPSEVVSHTVTGGTSTIPSSKKFLLDTAANLTTLEGQITASNLVVRDQSNLVHDPLFSEITSWATSGGATASVTTGNIALWKQDTVVKISGVASAYSRIVSKTFAVESGDTLLISMMAAVTAGTGSTAYFALHTSADGIDFAQAYSIATTSSTPEQISGKYIIPTGIRFAQLRLVKSGAGSVTEASFSVPRVRFMTDASLITEGALSEQGMAAFGDVLASNNYDPGNTGWQINNNGDAEFNSLLVRTGNLEEESVSSLRTFNTNLMLNVTSSLTWVKIGSLTYPQSGKPTLWNAVVTFDGYGDCGLEFAIGDSSFNIKSASVVKSSLRGKQTQLVLSWINPDTYIGNYKYWFGAKKFSNNLGADGWNANIRILSVVVSANQMKR
jgi:predicted phage tail protein